MTRKIRHCSVAKFMRELYSNAVVFFFPVMIVVEGGFIRGDLLKSLSLVLVSRHKQQFYFEERHYYISVFFGCQEVMGEHDRLVFVVLRNL